MQEEQDKVLCYYKESAKLNDQEASRLHMFFSPTRIPKGLTNIEVRILVNLYGARESQKAMIGWNKRFTREGIRSLVTGIGRQLHPPGGDENAEANFLLMLNPEAMFLPDELIPQHEMTRRRFKIGIRKFMESLEKEALLMH
jgi:hypothetical protein